ncbi:MAG: hypothetical protein COW00_10650 [Bdellovibrio sp. CG12_big_fil_rev_8_21_14_0_65_39_13]|nr:MAG: hypothetical protein COW78_13725 [Bdellovibrio sp. CG22_combo_CG10-13_8_21_14_all_39_27]PIQ59407.1 MAG: hypothetical protein COW00_10650 [Bdellovibrio sp. CG12_big_fil_rev_8_21_14_0_65_39_13]PIR34937.1 MAG: hypothetical protein COV37_11795 [Bdellovibrio sp. CG11_big_fil_rev_8_21_14_0_20_39_38]PJB52981.1 MAG: hypothetical protein CO099_09630 [Bdellovibrio sp. CG_4_9_14_3_um_filter_39_7]
MTINDPNFQTLGHCFFSLSLPVEVETWVQQENWVALDQWLSDQVQSTGLIGQKLSHYLNNYSVEHIISLRTSPDEDGIWHDDGSRDLAFSLSLNPLPESIKGGDLAMRKKDSPHLETLIPAQKWGTLILFLTGKQGFEHKTCAVEAGKRLVAAGWATERSS